MLEVQREELSAALRAIGAAKTSDPPYAHLTRVTLSGLGLDLEGCLPEARAESTVTAAGTLPVNTMFLPRDALARCIESALGDTVSFASSGASSVTIASDGFVSNLRYAATCATWPQWAAVDGDDIPVSATDWRQILRVRFAASEDQMSPVLIGVHLAGATAVATDKRRIARARLSGAFPAVTVPPKFLAYVDRFVEGDCTMRVGSGSLSVTAGSHRWTTTVLADEYPSLDRFLVDREEALLNVSPTELRKVIDRVAVFGRSTSIIRLETELAGSVNVTALGPEGSSASDRLASSGNWTGSLTFMPEVLVDAINAAASGTMTFGIVNGLQQPVLVREKEFTQMLMQTRISGV